MSMPHAEFPWGFLANSSSSSNGAATVTVDALGAVLRKYPSVKWFVVALDISFIIPENLRILLRTQQQQREPADVADGADGADGGKTAGSFRWFGKRLGMPNAGGLIFTSSGSGTVYSRAAAAELVATWGRTCVTASWMSEWYQNNADVAYAKCLSGNGRASEPTRTTGATATAAGASEELFGVYA